MTGIETAAEVAESHPNLRVVLIGRVAPGAMMGPKARAYLHAALDRLEIERRDGVEITKALETPKPNTGSTSPAELKLYVI